eukprot:TRINITY_DN1931_c0_g1_i9.p3 TRINITY_DN1931_c0_g1~~TRINITY_DN1931_c0_g1_i9.p3  ORF type:complete len:229 (+),score=58.17 TRINITY_DN1931_c0_g1_i9:1726-2412(+)
MKGDENEKEMNQEDDNKGVDNGGWINKNNIDQFLNKTNVTEVEEITQKVNVFVMTADFSMQNVLLQIGIPILSIDGLMIQKAKRFVLECYGCHKITRDYTKQFCPSCGNHSLLKVTCSINEDGSITLYRKKGFQVNQRGFIYSIPKQKGGRKNNDLILREDEMLTGLKKQQIKKQQKDEEKQFKQVVLQYDNGFTFDDIKYKQKTQPKIQFGYGRKNPNENYLKKKKK